MSGCLLLVLSPLRIAGQTQHRLTVGELFELVENESAVLAARKSSIDVAGRRVEEARARRLPDINASLSAAYNGNVLMLDRDMSNARGISQPHWSNSFALEAQQVVYAGGAVSAGIRLAEIERRQAETATEMTRSAERFSALGKYLDLFKIDNSIRVYESNITLTAKIIDDIKARHSEGMALQNDVTRYELQMETLRLGLRRLTDSRKVINYQLCNTLGLKNETIVPDSNVINEPVKDDNEAGWQLRASASSPRMKSSLLDIEAAVEQLNIEKSGLKPKLVVFAADNFSGPFVYDLPPIDKNFNIWYVGVGIRYSLSSLFKSNKSVSRAKSVVNMTKLESAGTAEAVSNSMNEAYTLYRQSFADLRTRQKSVELANSNYKVMNDRYHSQMALVTDMVDASNLKLDAELQEVNARAAIIFAYYRMKFIAGEI